MKERLDMLIAAGVKRAVFDGENLVAVEFFAASPAANVETSSGDEVTQGEDQFSEAFRALEQLKTRKFAGRDASAGGDA